MDDTTEHTDRLVDFLCVRETHQRLDNAGIVSRQSGALLLCPSGETLGHVWRAAVSAPSPDDRLVRRAIGRRAHLAAVPIAALN